MWLYSQTSGNLWNADGEIIATGYSGYGEGKNNPAMQRVVGVGPIPRGDWVVTGVYDSKKIGPYAIKLEPSCHKALDRTYFRFHGDSASRPGRASRGCLVFSKPVRRVVFGSGDKLLRVVE